MEMNREQFQRELDYNVAMALARQMLEQGVINREEFTRIDTIYLDRYRPVFRRIETPKARQE
jgi:hypothetical protein